MMDVKQWLKNKVADGCVESFHHESALNLINDLSFSLERSGRDIVTLRAELKESRHFVKESKQQLVDMIEKLHHVLNQNRFVPIGSRRGMEEGDAFPERW